MEARIQSLRRLAVKLDVSGTAKMVSDTKLYKGGYGFVLLQCYAPVTQNRAKSSEPLCTVHRTVVNKQGERLQFGTEKFNLLFVQTVTLDGMKYLLFERQMPKPFTDTVGYLEIAFNYLEIEGNKVVARMPTKVYRTYVDEGGDVEGELDIDIKEQQAAQVNANTFAIEQIGADFNALLQPPDISEANQVGIADVELLPDGRLKFSNLKGEKGDSGIDGSNGKDGANAVIMWGINGPSPFSTMEWEKI